MTWSSVKLFATAKEPRSLQTQVPVSKGQGLDHLPHGIYELMDYPWTASWLFWLGLTFLIFLLILALVYFFAKRHKSKKRLTKEDPLVLLRRSLRQVELERPFDQKRAAEFYYQLGLLFREVIEITCAFPATDSTLKELRQPLEQLPLKQEERAAVWSFFEQAEYIKFAQRPATYEQAEDRKNEVLSWSAKLISSYRQKIAEEKEQKKLKKKEKKGFNYD